MSAFIVSRQHIHQLVTAIDTYVAPTEEPTQLGQMLWNENIASVQHLYHDEPVSDLPGVIGETYEYAYVTPQRTLTPLEVYGMQRCYAYQACEHPGWTASRAYALTQALEAVLEAQLGKTYEQISRMPEYTWPDVDDDTPRHPEPPKPKGPVRRISLTDTAKLVRKALKAAYPTVKFSVRCDRYSMGCSIDVTWTDGPTLEMVKPLLRQFNGSHFDGMTDMKSSITQEYEGDEVKFEVDYVQGQRNISTAFMTQIACKVAAQYKVAVPAVENSGAKYGTGDHGYVPSSAASEILIPHAPPFGNPSRLCDVIHHIAHQTSALPKPRVTRPAIARQIA